MPQSPAFLLRLKLDATLVLLGTVAHGESHLDTHRFEGAVNGKWADTLPEGMSMSKELLERGQQGRPEARALIVRMHRDAGEFRRALFGIGIDGAAGDG